MNIGFFITASLKSTRLEKKILLELNGKGVLDHVIERCKSVSGIGGVVLCTTTEERDNPLEEYAAKHSIQLFRGSKDDVLQRLMDAAEKFKYDAFLSITADNPLFSISLSQTFADQYKQHSFDFIYSSGLPVGMGIYLIDKKALNIVNSFKDSKDTEIWGPYLNNENVFNVCEMNIYGSRFNDTHRITLDYPEDYSLIKEIYSNFPKDKIPLTTEIFNILEKKPDLFHINSMHKQRYLSPEIIQQIHNTINSKKEQISVFAKHENKNLLPSRTILKIHYKDLS